MKKLIKSYLIEIYEIADIITADKNEIEENSSKIIKTGIGNFSEKQIKYILNKRQKEIKDYYNGNLPHNNMEKICEKAK